MDLNKDLLTKILSIVSLVVLGYIFFISVYNQIIVQSGGVFFIVIFGGILILAFVLLSLVTKLIDITKEIKDNFMWNFVEILLLCNFAYLFFAFRLSYQTTIPAEETIIYRTASLLRTGELGTKGMDMFGNLVTFPGDYVYAFILSIFLRLSDGGSQAMLSLNAVVLILTAFIMDRIVRRMAGRACGVIAALCTLFIPSQSFAVYSYSSEFFFCFVLLLCLYVFFIVIKCDDNDNKGLLYSALLGALTALLCFIEPLMIICVIVFTVYFILRKKASDSNPVKPVAVSAGVAVIIFILLVFIKSLTLNTDIGNVMTGSLSRFALTHDLETDEKYTLGEVFSHFHSNLDNKNTNVTDNYHFLVNKDGEEYSQTNNAWFSLGTQMSYMFVIVMSIACAFYMFKSKVRDALPGFLLLVSCFLVLFFRSTDEASTYFMFEILIILASCGLNYMYLNHHPELRSTESATEDDAVANSVADKDVSEWGAIARARSLIFAGKGEPGLMSGNEIQNPVSQNTVPSGSSTAAPVTAAKGSELAEGMVSPEGYFSFFSLGAPASSAAPVETVSNEAAEQYVEETQPIQEAVTEQVYQEPVYEEAVYEGSAEEYHEVTEEYAEPVYEETVTEYDAAEEYAEPIYEEAVTEYEEPAEEYAEPVYDEQAVEYTEPAYEEAVTEYEEPSEEYAEPVYDEPAVEYAEPVYEQPIQEYSEQTHNSGVKSSYGNAAHALGFSFGADLFADLGGAQEYEEPESEYEEYIAEPIAQEPIAQDQSAQGRVYEAEGIKEAEFDIFGNEVPYEEELQPMAVDDAHKPYYASEDQDMIKPSVPAYEFGANYDADVDEFSFGESMPDMFNPGTQVTAEENAAGGELKVPEGTQTSTAAVKKKKVIRKVVKRVVKKAPAQEASLSDQINIKASFREDDALNSMINDMNFDEADSRYNVDDNVGSSGYVIEI